MVTTPEQQILEHWTRRELRQAHELCTSVYRRRILSFLTKKLNDAEDAQEAFAIYNASLWEALTSDAPPAELTGWLYKLARKVRRNKQRSVIRRGARFAGQAPDELRQASADGISRQMDHAERRAELVRLREELSDEERELLALVADKELSQREAAEILEITYDTLRTRLTRVTAKLKNLRVLARRRGDAV